MIVTGTKFASRYIVRGKIGDGGMQSVYAAEDTLIGRPVALKTPLPGQASRRFQGSAIIAARVNHHSVAKTYDYFEENDAVFLVEELVKGPNLDQLFPLGSFLDPNCAAHVMLHLAQGIAASHKAGVVHRDLKPSNVVCESGSMIRTVKITDFGIATLADEVFAEEAQSGEITKSTSGTIKGAIPYMSPEMLFRQPGDHPGTPSDIWSLGAMMFRLLSGAYPFDVGMMVPVNIKMGNRSEWPPFMVSNPQFAGLSVELQSVVESCFINDPAARPTADDIVERCRDLCFSTAKHEEGEVVASGSTFGRIKSKSGGLVPYHHDSVYGDSRVAVGDKVMFAAFPGSPLRRAHPVARLPASA